MFIIQETHQSYILYASQTILNTFYCSEFYCFTDLEPRPCFLFEHSGGNRPIVWRVTTFPVRGEQLHSVETEVDENKGESHASFQTLVIAEQKAMHHFRLVIDEHFSKSLE